MVANRAYVLETPHVFPSLVSHVIEVELPLDLPFEILTCLYGANVFLHIGDLPAPP